MFTVSAFARLSGVSAKVLRSYDSLGVFRPVWTDPSSAYRYYSPAQLPELRRVLALRDMGLGLGAIVRLVKEGADLADALDRRRAELRRERDELDRRLRSLDIAVEMAAAGSRLPDVVVRPLRAEPVATLDMDLVDDGDAGAAFYELEAHVRDIGRRGHRPPGAIVHDSAADDSGRVEIFVPTTGPIAATPRIGFRWLPACRAATLIHRGPYASVPTARAALAGWLAGTGLTPAGPLRIIYLQFGAEPELKVPRGYVVDRAADYVTELQLPVE